MNTFHFEYLPLDIARLIVANMNARTRAWFISCSRRTCTLVRECGLHLRGVQDALVRNLPVYMLETARAAEHVTYIDVRIGDGALYAVIEYLHSNRTHYPSVLLDFHEARHEKIVAHCDRYYGPGWAVITRRGVILGADEIHPIIVTEMPDDATLVEEYYVHRSPCTIVLRIPAPKVYEVVIENRSLYSISRSCPGESEYTLLDRAREYTHVCIVIRPQHTRDVYIDGIITHMYGDDVQRGAILNNIRKDTAMLGTLQYRLLMTANDSYTQSIYPSLLYLGNIPMVIGYMGEGSAPIALTRDIWTATYRGRYTIYPAEGLIPAIMSMLYPLRPLGLHIRDDIVAVRVYKRAMRWRPSLLELAILLCNGVVGTVITAPADHLCTIPSRVFVRLLSKYGTTRAAEFDIARLSIVAGNPVNWIFNC